MRKSVCLVHRGRSERYAHAGIAVRSTSAKTGETKTVNLKKQADKALKAKERSGRITSNNEEQKFLRNEAERRRALRKGEMINKFRDKVDWSEHYSLISSPEYNPDRDDDGERKMLNMSNRDVLVIEMQTNDEFSVIEIKKGTR